ncbi:hypothetical protein A4X06_0g5453 [Tilletia controversa]|uniref:Uncharacterized protein n=1 Tax=Tilletia controversa TaxID=13291 RepID=A0A8X7MR13_9BASI|nr:hypothetical protein CF328_g6694 [Tilletia controversa]KAE8245738.1 hypothetical protein A4X06_0g5453 [Tilletia controversa]
MLQKLTTPPSSSSSFAAATSASATSAISTAAAIISTASTGPTYRPAKQRAGSTKYKLHPHPNQIRPKHRRPGTSAASDGPAALPGRTIIIDRRDLRPRTSPKGCSRKGWRQGVVLDLAVVIDEWTEVHDRVADVGPL